MQGHDIVVIGASAGGVEVLREVVAGLPAGLAAAVFVVLHLPERSHSTLPEILARAGRLPASHARHGEKIQKGHIYVAPPDHHLMIDGGSVVLSRGPHHNRSRPAIDPLFTSAARAYGPRVIGVVLSGTLDDGSAGLARIKRHGGVAMVQDPTTALYAGMPQNALASVAADRCEPADRLGAAIAAAVDQPAVGKHHPSEPRLDEEFKASIAAGPYDMSKIGAPSVYACPECNGTLWEFDEKGALQFRCRVGHSFTSEGLLSEHEGTLEDTIWAAVRALEEHASLRRRLAKRMRENRNGKVADLYESRAGESERHAATLRSIVTSESGPTARAGEDPGPAATGIHS